MMKVLQTTDGSLCVTTLILLLLKLLLLATIRHLLSVCVGVCVCSEQAITGREGGPCCQWSGCHLKPSWRESSHPKLTHGENSHLPVRNKGFSSVISVFLLSSWWHLYFMTWSSIIAASFLPFSGLLGFCCGRFSPWATCHIRVAVTRKCWSLWPTADEWTRLKTAPDQCKRKPTHRRWK